MPLKVTPQDGACGAMVEGLDLRQPLSNEQIADIRTLWLQHLVLAFPGQDLAIEDIERFASTVGPFGVDPFFIPVEGHPHVAQVRREPDEQTPIFAERWHSDWSFLAQPPAATVLYGNIIPPHGGDTLFTNQYAVWDALPAELKTQLAGKQGIHSARRAYSPKGAYGEKDQEKGRSMAIRYSDEAMASQTHPLARPHSETGRTALFASPGYTLGIADMPEDEAADLLAELFTWLDKPEFLYRHRWSQGTLLMWDNRCVNHAATGGYEGHRRLLHRITVADRTLAAAAA